MRPFPSMNQSTEPEKRIIHPQLRWMTPRVTHAYALPLIEPCLPLGTCHIRVPIRRISRMGNGAGFYLVGCSAVPGPTCPAFPRVCRPSTAPQPPGSLAGRRAAPAVQCGKNRVVPAKIWCCLRRSASSSSYLIGPSIDSTFGSRHKYIPGPPPHLAVLT